MNIITRDEHTWIIEDDGVRFFILEGSEYTALIDTGMTIKDVKSIVTNLSARPIILLNTHADRDHVGANAQFPATHLSIHELAHFKQCHLDQQVIPLYEGDIIDLGQRKLAVIDLSGHTPGSIGFYDLNNAILISGDPLQHNGRVFMFGPQRSLEGYIASLARLAERKDDFKEIWPSHGDLPLDNSCIEKCLADAQDIKNNRLDYEITEIFNQKVRAYKGQANIYLCDD